MLIEYSKADVFQADKKVLGDVDFTVNEGEFIYIIGKVGAGKSSLLKTLYAELDIFRDEAEKADVLGRNMLRLKRRDVPALRREMGIIFQDFQLLHDRTVRKNLLFVLRATRWKKKSEMEARIREVLAKVGLADKLDAMPHELSGGEQQRIAIARALLNSPKIIIADEPTGNLDPDTAAQIVQLLQEICRTGTAVVMSTHNWSMIEQFPGKVYKCENGRLTVVENEVEIEPEVETENEVETESKVETENEVSPEVDRVPDNEGCADEGNSEAGTAVATKINANEEQTQQPTE